MNKFKYLSEIIEEVRLVKPEIFPFYINYSTEDNPDFKIVLGFDKDSRGDDIIIYAYGNSQSCYDFVFQLGLISAILIDPMLGHYVDLKGRHDNEFKLKFNKDVKE